jgi:integrase/recombinase XerD
MTGTPLNALARTLRQFFSTYLPSVHGVSRHTIDSYRYAVILLLRFLATRRSRSVADLDLTDIEAEEVLAFLDDLEQTRHSRPSTPFSATWPPTSRSNWRARNGSCISPLNEGSNGR